MTDNFLDEFLDEDEGFRGFTPEEWRTIDKAIKPYLKPDTDWDIEKFLTFPADEEALRKRPHTPDEMKALRKCLRIPADIESMLYDLTEGPLSPGTVLYTGPTLETLTRLEGALARAAKVYGSSDEALQMHLEDQMPEKTAGETAYTPQPGAEWTDLAHAETTTKMSFAGEPMNEHTVAADQRPYAFGRLLDVALAAVRQAKTRPVNPMITHVQQKRSAPNRNRTLNLAVWKLLEIFERETELKPTAHSNQNRKIRDAGTAKYGKTIYGGRFLPFALACLGPVNLVPRKSLNSGIRTAYTKWGQKAGSKPKPGPSKTHRKTRQK